MRLRRRPYRRVVFNGRPLDEATAAALEEVEEDLGYSLTIMQGIGGAEASAGTHTVGRAVDLAAWDWENKLRALKKKGFAAYYRPALPGHWGPHIHAVLILNSVGNQRGIAASAFRQIGSFLRGRNALSGDGPDITPARVIPQPVFRYTRFTPKRKPKPKPIVNNVTRARDSLAEAQAALANAAALLDETPSKRKQTKRPIDEIQGMSDQIESILQNLPKT